MKVAAELKLKHGVLWELCEKHGGVKALAEMLEMGDQTLRKWLNMKYCPTPGVYTRCYTEQLETNLVQLAGVSIEEIFPSGLREITAIMKNKTKHIMIAEMEPSALLGIAEINNQRLIAKQPSENLETDDLKRKVSAVLDTLDCREREIIKDRFGLGGETPMTLEEVGYKHKLTRERVRQIEAKALRKLQQPARMDELVELVEWDAPPVNFCELDKHFEKRVSMSIKERVGQ